MALSFGDLDWPYYDSGFIRKRIAKDGKPRYQLILKNGLRGTSVGTFRLKREAIEVLGVIQFRGDKYQRTNSITNSRIYFIESENGLIKIGRSIDLQNRFNALQQMSPVKLKLLASVPGGVDRETDLHRQFGRFRVHGEWFQGTPALRACIENLAGESI